MNIQLKYFGEVKNGKLIIRGRNKMISEIKQFEGKQIQFIIERKKRKRTIEQNRVQWMYYNVISEHLGYPESEIHEILKFKFLKTDKVNEETGEIFEYVKSTTELTTIEHNTYMEQIRQWASEYLSVFLPEPNEQIKMNYEILP